MRQILTIAALSFVASCTTLKPYPVCFYDKTPPDREVMNENISKLLSVMRRYDVEANSSADQRWILSKTSYAQHELLKVTWPRIACIGKVSSGTEVKAQADCVSYLHTFLTKKNYLELDVKDNAIYSDEAPGPPTVICNSNL